MRTRPFADRAAAGRALAERLQPYAGPDAVVLALPRGGVPVAVPVARALGAALDVVVVRKLGLPGRPELAMGAVACVAGRLEVVRNDRVLRAAAVTEEAFADVLDAEVVELHRREEALRAQRPELAVRGRTVVLVDDGLATGATMLAAVGAVRRQQPGRAIVAVPVGSPSATRTVARLVDELVCPRVPADFGAVGQSYVDFSQTSDDEVRAALAPAAVD